jgi:hypothetical protein
MDGLKEAEPRKSASWGNLEIYLIERWPEERARGGEEDFNKDKLEESTEVLR